MRTVYADGVTAPAVSLLNQKIILDNSNDTAHLLTSKKVGVITPIKELLWIWQQQSNDVEQLKKINCNIWNEWQREDGTIGKAYGYQLGSKTRAVEIDELFMKMFLNHEFSIKPDAQNLIDAEKLIATAKEYEKSKQDDSEDKFFLPLAHLNQVDYLLYQLKKNPYSRRIKTTLYNIEDLDDMALEPCVYETHWQMWKDKLHLTVNVRSNDIVLGNPYNVYQYSVLHKMIAQVSGLEAGSICFNIDNAHIYDRHIEGVKNQVNANTPEPPKLWINPQITSFYDFSASDIRVDNYKNNGSFKFEVAI